MDNKIKELSDLLLDLKSDIVVNYLIASIMMENPHFIKVDSDTNSVNQEGKKYTIGRIGGMNIIINPYQRFNDYKVYNQSGDLLLDLHEHKLDILDII